MAFSTVTGRAVGAVRAYFLRDDLDEPLMSFSNSAPVAVSVMRMVYLLLAVFFANSAIAFYSKGSLIVPMLLGSSMSYMLIYLVAPQLLDKRIVLLHAIAYLGPGAIILLRIDSGYLCDGLWIISVGLCCLSGAMKWENGFFNFHDCCLLLISTTMVASAILSWLDRLNMYSGLVLFLGYVVLSSETMIRRIVKGDDTDYVNHIVFLFTDLPYVYFRVGRMTLRQMREGFLMIKQGYLIRTVN